MGAAHNTFFIKQFQLLMWGEKDQRAAKMARRNIRMFSMLSHLIRLFRAWRRYDTSLRELSSLGDRELADIGVTRSDIPRIAWETARP
jgi:uncharacterized protein YjiS (DUF1127 family)